MSVLCGVIATIASGPMILVGLIVGFAALVDGASYAAVVLVWSLAGLIGLVAWFHFTLSYYESGRAGLVDIRSYWWLALLIGLAAAVSWLFCAFMYSTPDRVYVLLFEPILLPVALSLIWLRLTRDTSAPA